MSRCNRNGGNWRAAWRLAVSACVAALILLAGVNNHVVRAAADEEAWRQFRGQVVVSDVLLALSFGSDRVMITSLNRMRRSVVDEVMGFWRMHLVAFLDPGAEGRMLRVAARDVTSAENRQAARLRALDPVRVFEVPAPPDPKILQMNDLVLTRGMGFERGHAYEVTVEKDPDSGGKADVYARGVITLR